MNEVLMYDVVQSRWGYRDFGEANAILRVKCFLAYILVCACLSELPGRRPLPSSRYRTRLSDIVNNPDCSRCVDEKVSHN